MAASIGLTVSLKCMKPLHLEQDIYTFKFDGDEADMSKLTLQIEKAVAKVLKANKKVIEPEMNNVDLG